jgi:DNA-binding NtrC family response regulator
MEKVRVLYVDDNPHDRALVRDALEQEHGGFELTEASARADFERQLAAGGWDVVLSDFNILGYTGLQVIDEVRAADPVLPVLIVTGTGSEETGVEAI